MNSKAILGVSFAAVFAVSMILAQNAITPMAFADDDDDGDSNGSFLTIVESEVEIDDGEIEVEIETAGDVPLDGTSGAFGYALLTDGGSGALDNVMVLVTHLPLDDSSFEELPSGFHTHVLDLMAGTGACAGFDAEVDLVGSGANVAFDVDYDWEIDENEIEIEDIPSSDLGNPSSVIGVAAFTVTPSFGPLQLCVDVI